MSIHHLEDAFHTPVIERQDVYPNQTCKRLCHLKRVNQKLIFSQRIYSQATSHSFTCMGIQCRSLWIIYNYYFFIKSNVTNMNQSNIGVSDSCDTEWKPVIIFNVFMPTSTLSLY
jgi:hypothetical protein